MLNKTKALDIIENYFNRLDRLLWMSGSLLIGALTILVGINVVLRYVFGASQFWIQPLAIYLTIWAAMLIVGPLFREDEHLTINFLFRRFPAAYRAPIRVIELLIIMGFGIIVLYHGWEYAFGLGLSTSDPSLGLQMVWFYAAIPTCGLLIALYSTEKLLQILFDPSVIDADYERQFGKQEVEE